MPSGAVHLLVFRGDRRSARGLELKLGLMRELEALGDASPLGDDRDDYLRALLRAGELECGVADAGSFPLAPYMSITDRLAEALVSREAGVDREVLRRILGEAGVPEHVEIAPAEGFAYYGLHPLAFAEAIGKMPALPASIAVIGIRSIGTTLSAITAAAARGLGKKVARTTVRPAGHPYNRTTRLSPAQLAFVEQHVASGAAFVIVDEGPGLSGSSFLSAAEALVEAGVSSERILLLCGREPDFDSLCADGAPQRAREFRWIAISSEPRRPADAEIFIGGGEWRRHVFRAQSEWPGSWTSFERLKYLSSANDAPRKLFKFAGLGHYGEQVLAREEKIAAAGFGPVPHGESGGFASYPWIEGRPVSAPDLSRDVLARLAAYCAFRAQAFATELSGLSALEQMAEHNLHELGAQNSLRLRLEHPVLADARMQPHEWLHTKDGRMVKTDSGSHGGDHFFPGPTDIAWDLAGTIVEWNMNAAESQAFLDAYRRISGDNARARVTDFVTAYAVFRRAYCLMAAHALQPAAEQERLARAASQYRSMVNPERALAA